MAETVTVQRTIDAPPSEVWAALTDTGKIKEYFFGSDVDTDWRPGSPITFRGQYQGRDYEDKGEIKKVEQERSLSFTHYSEMSGKPDAPENYATVTYNLRGEGGMTDLRVTQTNCSGEEDQTRKNWETVLDGIAKTVEH